MTPSETLTAAADLIRDLAAHACKGPWFAPGPDDTEEQDTPKREANDG